MLDYGPLHCDAFAVDNLFAVTGIHTPPTIIVTTNFNDKNIESFTSVIEHEFVHIAQKLSENYPQKLDISAQDSQLFFNSFITNMKAEYEANFIQLNKYSSLFPEEINFTLQDWCILRGFTQILEKSLILLIFEECNIDLAYAFLNRIEGSLVEELKTYSIESKFLGHIEESLYKYLGTSLKILEDQIFSIQFIDKFTLLLEEADFQ